MRGVPDAEAAALYYEVAGMPLSARRQRRDATTPARTGRFRVTPVPISQVRRPLPNYLQQTLAAARQVQDWQEQTLRDLRAEGYEVEELDHPVPGGALVHSSKRDISDTNPQGEVDPR